jgi:hypothetical protein
MIKKIFSAGQGGVDRAARDVAVKYEIPWVDASPKHPHSEPRPLPTYPAALTKAGGNGIPRLKQEGIAADGTLLLSDGPIGSRQKRCRARAKQHYHPWLHIDLKRQPAFKAARLITEWLLEQGIETLHVAGPETDNSLYIYEKAFHILSSVYWLVQSRTDARPAGTGHENDRQPVTVEEAVDRLAAQMALKDRATVANMTEKELALLDGSLGAYVRNRFGVATGNRRLMAACRDAAADPNLKESDAAWLIIINLWKKLRKTHKLRIVK